MSTRLVAVAVAVAVLCGAGGAPAAPPKRTDFTWDVPRVLESVEVPGVMRADGIPVKLRSVKSAERPEVILQHLVDRFEQAGFYIPPDKHRTQWLKQPQLTALDTQRMISYTFVLHPNPDGTTSVVLGEANLGLARREASTFAPVFPGGKDLMRSEMEGARTLSYLVEADVTRVHSFYAEKLRAAGYSDLGEGTWRRGTEELRLSVRPVNTGRVSVILLSRTVPDDGREAAAREGPRPVEPKPAPPAPQP